LLGNAVHSQQPTRKVPELQTTQLGIIIVHTQGNLCGTCTHSERFDWQLCAPQAIYQAIVHTQGNVCSTWSQSKQFDWQLFAPQAICFAIITPGNCSHPRQFVAQLFALLAIYQAIVHTSGNLSRNYLHSRQFVWQLLALQAI
jgi:hypothetical protein